MLKILGVVLVLSLAVTPAFAQAQAPSPVAKSGPAKAKGKAAKPKGKAPADRARPAAAKSAKGAKAPGKAKAAPTKAKAAKSKRRSQMTVPMRPRTNITQPGDILRPNSRD